MLSVLSIEKNSNRYGTVLEYMLYLYTEHSYVDAYSTLDCGSVPQQAEQGRRTALLSRTLHTRRCPGLWLERKAPHNPTVLDAVLVTILYQVELFQDELVFLTQRWVDDDLVWT